MPGNPETDAMCQERKELLKLESGRFTSCSTMHASGQRMPALPDMPRCSALDSFTVKCRLATLAAYGVSLIFLHYAESLAEKVYDDLCSSEGITFAKPTSVLSLVVVLVVFSVPTLLARSRAVIVANLTTSLITAGGAVLLLFTASDTPYECFTMGGPMRITRQDLENLRCGVFSFCSHRSRYFSLICRCGPLEK